MKKVTVITTNNAKLEFLTEDDQAEDLKTKLAEGVANLTSSTDSSYSWVNMRNVIQVQMDTYVEKAEKDSKDDSQNDPQK